VVLPPLGILTPTPTHHRSVDTIVCATERVKLNVNFVSVVVKAVVALAVTQVVTFPFASSLPTVTAGLMVPKFADLLIHNENWIVEFARTVPAEFGTPVAVAQFAIQVVPVLPASPGLVNVVEAASGPAVESRLYPVLAVSL
jgi:hypothetical protein